MSSRCSDYEKRGRTMDAALKSFVVKRMRELQRESRIEDKLEDRSGQSSRIKIGDDSHDVSTPSSFSDTDEEKHVRKSVSSEVRKCLPGSTSVNKMKNNVRITVHCGRSPERQKRDPELRLKYGLLRAYKNRIKENRDDHLGSATMCTESVFEKSGGKRKSDRRHSRSSSHSPHSNQRSNRRHRVERRCRNTYADSNRKRSLLKNKKVKSKKEKRKTIKTVCKNRREKKKSKRDKTHDVKKVAVDKNDKKMDYLFQKSDPKEFSENGQVSEEVSDLADVVDLSDSDCEYDDTPDGSRGSALGDSTEHNQPRKTVSEAYDSGPDEFESELHKVSSHSSKSVHSLDPPMKFRHLSDVSSVGHADRQSLNDDEIFEHEGNCRSNSFMRSSLKDRELRLDIKLSDASKSLILANSESQMVLEDGEVVDYKSEQESNLNDSDFSCISSGSLSDVVEQRKKKKRDKKEKRKERKKKKGRRSHSRHDASPRREKRDEHTCSYKSPSDRRRSRSPDDPFNRWRSRSPRSRSWQRSRSPRRRRSRSPAYYQWKQREQLKKDYHAKQRRRSGTPVRERLGRKRSRSPSLNIDKAALRAAAIRNTLANQANGNLPVSLTADAIVRLRSGASEDQKQLTEFCKNLMRKPNDISESDEEPTQRPVHSDFEEKEEGEVADGKGGIVFNIKNAKQVPVLTPAERAAQAAVLSKQFPVSSGSFHRKHEDWITVVPKTQVPKTAPISRPAPNVTEPASQKMSTLSGIAYAAGEHKDGLQTLCCIAKEITMVATVQARRPSGQEALPALNLGPPQESIFPVQARPGNISELVTQRLAAMKRIALNPNDVEAISQVYEVNQKIEEWSSSKMLPGQFHGSTHAKILSKEELDGNKRVQCWARPGQFQAAQPVKGLGMFLLEKMGWKQGTGLGKNSEGPTEPLILDLKNDRKGLISNEEILVTSSSSKPKGKLVRDLSEKHPTSALMELCQRRKWRNPNFIEVNEEGPAHKKRFLFKVIVNGIEYQPTLGCQTKKMAKADAANVCLQALGLVPKHEGNSSNVT